MAVLSKRKKEHSQFHRGAGC